jgi:hypothetical protein
MNTKRKLLAAFIILFGCSVLATFILAYNSKPTPEILSGVATVDPYATWHDDIIHLHNVYRQENGLEILHESEKLNAIAKYKTMHMIENCYWSHYYDGETVSFTHAKDFGFNYIYMGENLGNDDQSVQQLFNAWVNSPTHNDNILNRYYNANTEEFEDRHYTEIGVFSYNSLHKCDNLKFVNLTTILFGTEVE